VKADRIVPPIGAVRKLTADQNGLTAPVFISMSKGLCIRWSENFIAMARTSFIASSRRLADAWRMRQG
jgi:hypothetical protein